MKACIFDLGNVLFRFDSFYMTHAYIHDPADAALCAPVIFDRRLWDRLDDGTVTDSQVRQSICEQLPSRLHVAACAAYDHWFENMPEIAGMRSLVRDVGAAGMRRYLLSNISVGFEQAYSRVEPVASMLEMFDGCVFSGSIGIVKPDPAIFQLLLDRFNLNAADCVFLDDSEKNVSGAAAVGIRSVLFDGDADHARAAIFSM
jgi:FMN phosphatase YigB (HAD superfamily)